MVKTHGFPVKIFPTKSMSVFSGDEPQPHRQTTAAHGTAVGLAIEWGIGC